MAAQLVKKGDFLAPRYPKKKYGYGCILYDHVCDFSTEGNSLYSSSFPRPHCSQLAGRQQEGCL